MAASEPDPLAELRTAVEVGFVQLRGHVDTRFAEVNGTLNVMNERQNAMAETQKRHDKEIDRSVQRRWPLPVVAALGGLGGIASLVAWAVPHK